MHQLQLNILAIAGSIITYFGGIATGILPAGILTTIVTTIIICVTAFFTNWALRKIFKTKENDHIEHNGL